MNANHFQFFLIICGAVFLSFTFCASNRVRVSIIVMFSTEGGLESISDTLTIAKLWKKHLNDKYHSDPKWPFQPSVEFIDVKSDPDLVSRLLLNRIHNHSLPNVTAIIGPEIEFLGYIAAEIAAIYDIPCILGTANPDPIIVGRPPYLSTAFLMQPAVEFLHQEIIHIYTAQRVNSLVVVSMGGDEYDSSNCDGVASLAASKGVKVLAHLTVPLDGTSADVLRIVTNLRDVYRPDAVFWCDWASCTIPNSVLEYNPLPLFKKANYLPKLLQMLDCLDQASVSSLYEQGLFSYVTQCNCTTVG